MRAMFVNRFVLSCMAAIASLVSLAAGEHAVARLQPEDPRPGAALDPTARQAIGEIVSKAFVQVEITARYDQGQPPNREQSGGIRSSAASAAGVTPRPSENWVQLIDEERPAVQGGFLVGPRRVYTSDPLLHPRFIKSIRVRFGNQVVDAKLELLPLTQGGMFLELSGPLAGAEPVKFDASAPGPFAAVEYDDSGRLLDVGPMESGVTFSVDGARFIRADPETLFVNAAGMAVGLAGVARLPMDGAWKGDPAGWPALTAAQAAEKFAAIEKSAAIALPRVAIALRSPPSKGERRAYDGERDETESATEWNGTGVMLDETTVLVLAKLKPKAAARVERIRVFDTEGNAHSAKFGSSLREWGAFTAKLDTPLSGTAKLAKEPILGVRDRLLARAEVAVRGESRSARVWQQRVFGFVLGRHGKFYPDVPTNDQQYGAVQPTTPLSFLFDLDGSLLALPLQHREKVASERSDGVPLMVPAALLAEELARGADAFDPENRPLAEEDENRLAWLGVELQGLDAELARANGVSDQTEDGASGAIVTFVYENSPASSAGLRAGDVLLRIHVEGQPRPLEIAGDFDSSRNMQNFWQYLDQIPPEYFERIPTPWPASETTLVRSLTDLGFGTPFSVEIYRDGKVSRLDMRVAQSPPHYEAAKRFTSEELGITVRDITYEVRRYFRLKPGDPGVIVSKIEKGGKAAIAGVKPYEIVTSINDQPVASVADAEKGLRAGGELRLGIKRMTQGRIVKVKAEAPETPKDVGKRGADPSPTGGDGTAAEKK